MAVAQRIEEAAAIPRQSTRGRAAAGRPARSTLRLVPSAEALLHPRAAEALVLAGRPLAEAR